MVTSSDRTPREIAYHTHVMRLWATRLASGEYAMSTTSLAEGLTPDQVAEAMADVALTRARTYGYPEGW